MSSSSNSSQLPILDETAERGLQNPRIIDLIELDSERNILCLAMIEFRKWDAVREQANDLQEKFNNYLDYVLDGFLVQQYPQYDGVPVEFRLEMVEALPEGLVELVEAMTDYAKTVGIVFTTTLKTSLKQSVC